MKIYEYGSREKDTVLLIHGFQCPYRIWLPYVKHFETQYHVLVPALPGHDPEHPEEFISFKRNAEEIEAFCRQVSKTKIFAVYGISMGGVQAAVLWHRGNLVMEKLIMESSPLMPFSRAITALMTRSYLDLTHKTRQRDEKTLQNAEEFMGKENYPFFVDLVDHMTDSTLGNYLSQVFPYEIPGDCDSTGMEVYYFYGGKPSELPFRRTAAQLKKKYPDAITECIPGKGHCEDVIKNPAVRISALETLLSKNEDRSGKSTSF